MITGLYLSITLSIFLPVLTTLSPRLTLRTPFLIPLGVIPLARPDNLCAVSSFMGTPAMVENCMICCLFVDWRYPHIVSCVSSSSMRFMIFFRTDFARLSFFAFPRRRLELPLLSCGGDNSSPMSPKGLPPPLPLPLLPVSRELNRDDEKSLDDPAPGDGMKGLVFPPIPPNIPSRNGFDPAPIPMGDDGDDDSSAPVVALPSLINLP
mmetsp:Transcript_17220/g.24366  ORF Transcript_17220/g.24366 Transcript_17220/m.24366 type:complete len:208 (-) Transcript_17220:968-1591(-)